LKIYLVLERGSTRIAIEIKHSPAPKVGAGFWHCLEDLSPSQSYVVAPVKDSYPIQKGVEVINLMGLI
jgi:hypothetical protein